MFSLLARYATAAEVRLGNTPLATPVLVVAGTGGFEAVAAVANGGGCRVPHLILRATSQFDWWDVPLVPGQSGSILRHFPLGPLPHDSIYVSGRTGQRPENVAIGGNDNNAVTLPDGSVFVAAGATTWADNIGVHPPWWGKDYPSGDPTTVRVGAQAGQRGFQAFWRVACNSARVADQDTLTWTNTGLLDAAFAGSTNPAGHSTASDYCALNPEGIAAWDRPEVYADPFHGSRVYLAMACATMQKQGGDKPTVEVVRRSDDLGRTWQLGTSVPHAEFHSMATTPQGGQRLWLLGGSMLRWSNDAGATVAGQVDLAQAIGMSNIGSDIYYTRVSTQSPHALARLGNGKLVAAYPTKIGSATAYALALVTKADSSTPKIATLRGGPVQAQAFGGSVFDLALVPDSRPGGAGAVLAYWLETGAPPQPRADGSLPDMRLRARYAVISPISDQVVLTGDLADTAGWLHRPPTDTELKACDDHKPDCNSGTWYGDYFHGAAFSANRPDAVNFALVWPEELGLYTRTLTVLDPEFRPERYSAIWTKATEDRPAIWGWARADFDAKARQMKDQGYGLLTISAFVLPDGAERYNAIWGKTQGDRPAVWGWARTDFDARAKQMKDRGYGLLTINAFVLPDGTERYNAIWSKTQGDRPAVWGWARTDFDAEAQKKQDQGYRLLSVNAFVLPNNGDRWNGVWTHTAADQPAVWGWARADFDSKAMQMKDRGYKFLSLNAFVLPGQGERYNAVWERTEGEQRAVWSWGRGDFDAEHNELKANGFRLNGISAY